MKCTRKEERDIGGFVKCIFFALFLTIMWYFWTVSMLCWGLVKLVDVQKCLCNSSVVYLHSISLICNRTLYDGTVYNLSVDWWFESPVNNNVLSWRPLFYCFGFVFFAWPKFPSKIKNCVYFCKRDYLCGLMPWSMVWVCTNSSRQEQRESWRSSSFAPAVAWDAVKIPPHSPSWSCVSAVPVLKPFQPICC